MWNQRAQFDIAMRSSTNESPPQQIYVSCNFCGKSIAAFMQGLSRTRAPFGRLGSTSNKSKVKVRTAKFAQLLLDEENVRRLFQYIFQL